MGGKGKGEERWSGTLGHVVWAPLARVSPVDLRWAVADWRDLCMGCFVPRLQKLAALTVGSFSILTESNVGPRGCFSPIQVLTRPDPA